MNAIKNMQTKEEIQDLIAQGAHINATSNNGGTALIFCRYQNHLPRPRQLGKQATQGIHLETMEKPKTKLRKLVSLGIPPECGVLATNTRKRYWRATRLPQGRDNKI